MLIFSYIFQTQILPFYFIYCYNKHCVINNITISYKIWIKRTINKVNFTSRSYHICILSFPFDWLNAFISNNYIRSHNDLPYNFYQILSNNLSAFHFEKDLRNDSVWGSNACSSCFTDLPRLNAGKVGGQVSHDNLYIRLHKRLIIFRNYAAYLFYN